MVKYICPTCDKVMKSRHICTDCKKWVRNPWVRDIDFYLNERHPQGEEDCTYHDRNYSSQGADESKKPLHRPHTPASRQVAHSKSVQDILDAKTPQQKEQEDSKPKRSVSPFGIVILIFIFINVVMPILVRVLRSLSDMLR